MSTTVKVIVKNVIEFEVEDSDRLEESTWMREHLIVMAKNAMLNTPSSIIANDAKYKLKIA